MPRKKQTRHDKETSPRHVWLASLGAVVVARREVATATRWVAANASRLRDGAIDAVADALAIARGGALVVREQVQPRVGQFSAEVESRLQPVLAKLGLPSNANGPSRRARATRKPTVRPVPRKTAAASPRTRRARA